MLAAPNSISVEDFGQYFQQWLVAALGLVLPVTGITLKGTKVSNLYKYFKYFFLTILGIFGSPSYISWFINLNR